MSYKIIARDDTGKKIQVDPTTIGGANVVLPNVTCLASVFVGAVVIMDVGGFAKNAIANSLANSNIIGVVESKASTVLCNIRVIGVTDAIFSGLDVTKEYFLSDSVAGTMVNVAPIASGSVIIRVGQPFSATELLVNKGQRVVRS